MQVLNKVSEILNFLSYPDYFPLQINQTHCFYHNTSIVNIIMRGQKSQLVLYILISAQTDRIIHYFLSLTCTSRTYTYTSSLLQSLAFRSSSPNTSVDDAHN